MLICPIVTYGCNILSIDDSPNPSFLCISIANSAIGIAMSGSGLVQTELTEREIQVVERLCENSISVCVAVGSGARKEDVSKRLKTTKKVALTMTSLAKTHNGWLEIGYRDLCKQAGVSIHALQRSLDVLVEDHRPPPPADGDFDPVLWNMDGRRKREGRMFLCLRRGTYPSRRESVYRLKDSVLDELGWNRCRDAHAPG